jgi:hypothetical protein
MAKTIDNTEQSFTSNTEKESDRESPFGEAAISRESLATPRLVMERKGKIEDLDRSFDIEFWQAQDTTARLSAVWELVEHSYLIRGKDVSELRLQRTVERFSRQAG